MCGGGGAAWRRGPTRHGAFPSGLGGTGGGRQTTLTARMEKTAATPRRTLLEKLSIPREGLKYRSVSFII